MKIRPGKIFKWTGIALLGLLAAGVLVPYINADEYAGRLRDSISRALGRQVEFRGKVRFSLFKGPGFSVSNPDNDKAVVIHEDPSIGLEPMAYVDAMEIRPSFWGLLRGKFVVASIRLEGANINLTKTGPADEPGRWNFLSFVNRSVMSAAPAIHVRDGRIHFKFGDTKSMFYLTETDLDISPPGSLDAGWKVSCEAKPARTDRPATGLAVFTLKGRWFVAPERVDLDLALEPSGLGEITALMRGQAGSVHGSISSKLHLGGPIDNIGIQGRLNIEDVHRWDLIETQGRGWPFDIRGRLNLADQQLELQSSSPGNAPLPLWLRVRATDYLSRPHWAFSVNWNRFPVGPILELARHMGAEIPPKLQLAGVMDGALGYSQDKLQGMVAFHNGSVTIPDSPPVGVDEGAILFDGGHIRLTPAVVRTGDQGEARLEADYVSDAGTLDLAISSDQMQVEALRAQVALAAVPWLEQVKSGKWSGELKYHFGPKQSGWTGKLQLTNAELAVPGLADPVQLASARAQIDGARVAIDRISGVAGKVEFGGGYTYEPAAARPHRINLRLDKVDAGDVEAELRPTLSRSPGIIARALGRTGLPDWLQHRGVEGTVQMNSFLIGESTIDGVKAKLIWDAARVQLDGLQAKLDKASIAGKLVADLSGSRPRYRLTAQVKGWTWQSGKLDGDVTLAAAGTGLQLLTGLSAEGAFTASGIDFGGLSTHTCSGNYAATWSATGPRLRFTGLNVRTEDDTYTGRGASQDDGRLLVVLNNGAREVRLSGPVDKLKVEEAK